MDNFLLPRRLTTYRQRLHAQYAKDDKLLADLVAQSHAFVVEETVYDNWDGGTYGHDVQLYLPIEELSKVDINDLEAVTQRICEDLNKLSAPVGNEFFANVHLEAYDENEENCQRAIPLQSRVPPDADSLSIWKPGLVRLFISHRDKHKIKVNELAVALEAYGISSFVAHDSIQPMTKWQAEILKGLETMEILLAFVTNDFHQGVWADQEIGFALGQNIPIVSLKLQETDPCGFIGDQQALKCSLDDLTQAAPEIYTLLSEILGNKPRLQSALIRAFLRSPDWDETRKRFDRMRRVVREVSDIEAEEIADGFANNYWLHNAFYLVNHHQRLSQFMKETTGKDYSVKEKCLSLASDGN